MENAKKLLIIDDEKMIAEPLAERFESEGFKIEMATDGEEGLQKALEILPDLILLDVVMPKMDGLTMLGKLRENEKGKNIPVIVFTNTNDAEKISKAVEGGASEFLVKVDWSLEDLVKKVKNKLGMQ